MTVWRVLWRQIPRKSKKNALLKNFFAFFELRSKNLTTQGIISLLYLKVLVIPQLWAQDSCSQPLWTFSHRSFNIWLLFFSFIGFQKIFWIFLTTASCSGENFTWKNIFWNFFWANLSHNNEKWKKNEKTHSKMRKSLLRMRYPLPHGFQTTSGKRSCM